MLQDAVYPEEKDEPICDKIHSFCAVPTNPPSVQWQTKNNICNSNYDKPGNFWNNLFNTNLL